MATDVDWDDLHSRLIKTDTVWIKKLSRNDRSWADAPKDLHQAGFYVPKDIRSGSFFPPLININPAKPHIFEAEILTEWLGSAEHRRSRMVHYSNKGPETHVTRVPREEFSALTPASLLICGFTGRYDGTSAYWVAVVDSASETASFMESLFDLNSDFHSGLFEPKDYLRAAPDATELLVAELRIALAGGALDRFVSVASGLPSSDHLAILAQAEYLNIHKLKALDPFEIENPGDAIMEISRDIEYRLYKAAEIRHRAADVLRILTSGTLPDLPSAIVRGYPELTATFLSASQHRKSRAGRSFENHIARLLSDGNVAFQAQAVTGGRRPDFVLPDAAALKGPAAADAIILSAKTTLRERWKQVAMERFESEVFLATVDDRISGEAIKDMARQRIRLVVPESLKRSKETDYGDKENVITFRDFFDGELKERRPATILQRGSFRLV
jgi:hypothetical protein